MSKVIDDTLKNSSGKFSRKNMLIFSSYLIAVVIAFIIIISEIYNKKLEMSYRILELFLGMAGYSTLLTVADKKISNKDNDSDILTVTKEEKTQIVQNG